MYNDQKTRRDRLAREQELDLLQAFLILTAIFVLGWPVLYFIMSITD